MDFKEEVEGRLVEGTASRYRLGVFFFAALAMAAVADSSRGAAKVDSVLSARVSPNSEDAWNFNRENDSIEQMGTRQEGNRQELRNIRTVDSVGWLKTLAFKRPSESMEQLQRQRQQRKTGNLIAFCNEHRFQAIGEVDSLTEMTDQERALCKARLKLINPTLH